MSLRFDVCVVGMGYVGVTLAAMLAHRGLRVFGLEVRPEVVACLEDGVAPFHENGLDEILSNVVKTGRLKCAGKVEDGFDCNTFIITVGTPLDSKGNGRLDMICRATEQVAKYMAQDSLVVLRSTVLIGTTRNTVMPILERSRKSFHLAMCPERTLEGNAVKELEVLPQIVGGVNGESARRAVALFGQLTPSTVIVASPETAEMVKLVDNTFRDVQFAFGNEVARACEAVGINAADVIKTGKLGYPRTNVALPGPVGGPCLEKDPHILMQSISRFSNITLEITKSARLINERQPKETIKKLASYVSQHREVDSLHIVLAGIAFKGCPETDDLRGSMAFPIYEAVEYYFAGSSIKVYDPVVKAEALAQAFPSSTVISELEDAVADADIFIIANNHPAFSERSISFYTKRLSEEAILFDYWNHFSPIESGALSGRYFSIGNFSS